jgi:hypothetical protein
MLPGGNKKAALKARLADEPPSGSRHRDRAGAILRRRIGVLVVM